MLKAKKITHTQAELFLVKAGFTYHQKIELLPLLLEKPELFETLEKHVSYLLGPKCELSKTQITRICCSENGLLNIQAFIQYYEKIRQNGFDFTKVLSILDSHEAYHIFPIMNKWTNILLKKNIKMSYIQFLFQNIDDEKDIASLIAHINELSKLCLPKELLFSILSMNLLDKTIELYRAAIELGFKNKQIILMLNVQNMHKELEQITKNYAELQSYGFDRPKLLELLIKENGDKILESLVEKFPKLIGEQFSIAKLLPILYSENGVENIAMLYQLSNKLINFRFTRDEIIKMAHHPDGAFRLQALSTRTCDLHLLRYTPIKILSIVLEEISNTNSVLYKDDMSKYQNEIDEKREAYFLHESNMQFFSIFAKSNTIEESSERLSMTIEDIDSSALNKKRLEIFEQICKI